MRISAALLLLLPLSARAETLRVCADPNNLPFSNRAGEGFEDKIAMLVARDLHMDVRHAYALQNERFLKHTLLARKCDVVMGVSTGVDELDTTRPYYASTYVFVTRAPLKIASLQDPRLRGLKIGAHLIGDESTPPMLALGREGIVDNVRGFMIQSGFDKPNPAARPVEAVAHKDIDVAAVWGPFGGYFAKRSPVALNVVAMTGTGRFAPLRFQFAIAMGVRKGDPLKARLDDVIAREGPAIRRILSDYGVPEVPEVSNHG
ncbi:MAG TPA: quinoprotein dehydrogenase-associated putative ABC transporter substrate-binding protein [Rhizomicrobium sp.]|nr:quinoprotein dehydrogenase-associated putative ABC transporter substrate-binding protein [Rhizomicrobium sp.]